MILLNALLNNSYQAGALINVAMSKGDSVFVSPDAISLIMKPAGIFASPYFWNVVSVIVGGILTLSGNLIIQFVLDRSKQKKERNANTLELSWSIIRGIELSRSVDSAGFSANKNNPMRHIAILPGIGANPSFKMVDITKVGFLSGVISSEFPSKAQEYLSHLELTIETIRQRNIAYSTEFQPYIANLQRENPTKGSLDENDITNLPGSMIIKKLKDLTDAIYYQLEYLESNGNIHVNSLNAALKIMNKSAKIPPQLRVKPKYDI